MVIHLSTYIHHVSVQLPFLLPLPFTTCPIELVRTIGFVLVVKENALPADICVLLGLDSPSASVLLKRFPWTTCVLFPLWAVMEELCRNWYICHRCSFGEWTANHWNGSWSLSFRYLLKEKVLSTWWNALHVVTLEWLLVVMRYHVKISSLRGSAKYSLRHNKLRFSNGSHFFNSQFSKLVWKRLLENQCKCVWYECVSTN